MSHRLQVLIPEDLDERLRKAAARRRLSKGELVRRALEEFLRTAQVEVDPLDELSSLQGPTGDIDQTLDDIDRGRESRR